MNTLRRRLLPILVAVLVILIPSITLAADNFIETGLQSVLWTIVNVVFGWMVWAGGLLLNYGITDYVVGFGKIFKSSGLGYSINSLWATVRDIFNLTFIFGLVYIGFKMIFDSGDSNAKRMLGSLILAALLVNFSLFITKFIIDFSNIAATQFAQAFNTGGAGTYAVSDGFMKLFGLSSVFGAELPDMAGGSGYAYIFGTLFLYLIAAFVFAVGGLLLIIRFVVLNIYMILSPLMFLGFVFPGLKGISNEYWKGFLGRAFFAPAYILMLYFAHQVLVNMQGVVAAGSKGMAASFAAKDAPGAVVAAQSFGSTIVFFIITAVFLIAALVVAQKMGAVGASNAVAMGKRLGGTARRYATNTATYIPRAGARMGVNASGEYIGKKFNNLQTKSGVLAWAAKTNAGDRLVRGTTTAMAGAQFGTSTTNKAERDYKTKTVSRANQTATENARAAGFKDNLTALTDNTKTTGELTTALDELGKAIKSMTKDEKNGLDLEQLTNKSVATNLSDDDIKNLEASGNFNATDIQKIKAARKDGFTSMAVAGSTLATVTPPPAGAAAGTPPTVSYQNTGAGAAAVDQRHSLVSSGTKSAGNLPIDVFKEQNMYTYITPAMLEERMRNGITPTDLALIRTAIEKHLGLNPNAKPSSNAALINNPWSKWEGGNSVYAAQFFN